MNFLVTRINYANELLNMAAERCKCYFFAAQFRKKLLCHDSNVFKIGGNMHRDFVYCMKLIFKRIDAKKIMQN